jgi:translation initiation factor IF-1
MRDNTERLEFDGEVLEMSRAIFKVKVSDKHIVQATLSGKIRQNSVKILIGDRVRVEVSPYDIGKGRIIFRYKTPSK